MSNFMREIYIRNGGRLNLPYHGEGSKMGVEEGNVAPGLFGGVVNCADEFNILFEVA
jgi:hypothetical protein